MMRIAENYPTTTIPVQDGNTQVLQGIYFTLQGLYYYLFTTSSMLTGMILVAVTLISVKHISYYSLEVKHTL